MHSVRSVFVLFACAATVCGADGIKLPPLDGTFSGEISPFGTARPTLHWTATARRSDAGDRTVSIRVEGPGANGSAEGFFPATDDGGHWRVPSLHLDLSVWYGAIAEKLFPSSVALNALGDLSASGEGDALSEGMSGRLRLELANGSVADPAKGWSVQGIGVALFLPKLPVLESAPNQELKFSAFNVGEFSTREGQVEFQIESTKRIRVEGARISALGGTVIVSPFFFDAEKAEVEAVLKLDGVELGALRVFFPDNILEAQGKVDGQFILRFSDKNGFQIGDGRLQVRSNSVAKIRVAMTPGLLSSRVPKNTAVPKWVSLVAPNASTAFKAHDTLRSIETGQEMLVIDSVQAELHGAADGNEPTAIVKLVAHPTQVDAVKTVRLNLNIFGPLADVVRYGLKGKVSFGEE